MPGRRILLLLVLMTMACGCAVRHDIRSADLSISDDEPFAAAWDRYTGYIQTLIDGAEYERCQLELAVHFFQTVTEIPTRLTDSYHGLILDRDVLQSDLDRWNEWYRASGEGIDVDTIRDEVFTEDFCT